uniref:Uncharacterized protein n=1 Tax=viral metagenome TaxID=1070528 RepID=A0A6C0KS51_9ZZZZ
MTLNYCKPFSNLSQVLPARLLPLLSCPTCSSVKASICKNCGTFICKNTHSSIDKDVEFYYDKKSVTIERGHDPECNKTLIDGKQIAQEVVDLLLKNELVENTHNFNISAPCGIESDVSVEEWRKHNPYPIELPNNLKEKFIGLTSVHARMLYPLVRIYRPNDIIELDLCFNRLNLICNDEESGVIVDVEGFF